MLRNLLTLPAAFSSDDSLRPEFISSNFDSGRLWALPEDRSRGPGDASE